ncbi:nucleoside hydrolase [Nocardia sp. CA-120079]|uniref:nucleoside hydrolase n=1 Tax=Nocardia sp. CA-120079 TaxID=3239974 RepID=UPI003D960011
MNSTLEPTVLVDTDWGDDIDDAVSVALAARAVDRLAIVTADETGDHRARGVAEQLRRMDRPDVPVIRGIDIGGRARRRSSMGLATLPRSADPEVIEALTELCETSSELIWIGQGPMTNLARFVTERPDHCEKIRLTQMGGWLTRYRDPSRASHNLRIAPRAAGLALRTCSRPRLVLSEHTESPAIRITAESEFYRRLTEPYAPDWAKLLADGFDEWFAYRATQTQTAADQAGGVGSWLHDPLALSAALGLGFVNFEVERIRVAADARIYRDPAGREMEVSTGADYEAFSDWAMTTLFAS